MPAVLAASIFFSPTRLATNRRSRHTDSNRKRIHDGDRRFCLYIGRSGVFAQMTYKINIHQCKHTFHTHFKHHRNGQ